MMRGAILGIVLTLSALSAWAGEAVRIENATKPTRCAEEDNVYVKFIGTGIRHLTIEALHPHYLGDMKADQTAPDFSHCDMSNDPSYKFTPKDVTLFDNGTYRLVGHTFGGFWRPESVDFRVGSTVTRDLHLVQLIRNIDGHWIEILVVYPSDGYWRAKPLPPPGVADTAYGSSFLIGPVEEHGRPFVPLKSIVFDPTTLTFTLGFRNGDGALRVAEASPSRTRLEVTLPPGGGIFAALRSMFVATAMADTAEAVVRTANGATVKKPILAFADAEGTEAVFGRSIPSRHNTSAPDMRFGDFTR